MRHFLSLIFMVVTPVAVSLFAHAQTAKANSSGCGTSGSELHR